MQLDINSKQSGFELDSILYNLDKMTRSIKKEDSLHINIIEDVSDFIRSTSDTSEINIERNSNAKEWHTKRIYVDTNEHQLLDSLSEEDFKTLTSKVMISMTSDTLKIEDIDQLIKSELQRKDLNIDYNLVFTSQFSKLQIVQRIY